MTQPSSPRALALFSGGLDSILAVKLVEEQGVDVTCLHFYSPFFGKPEQIRYWEKIYGLTIRGVDVGEDFAALMARRPVYGFGSVLNPCVDCKILMLRHAGKILEAEGACCVVSGEVLGQRPMSQRRDTLNVIRRDADLKGRLLRPLSALHLDPTDAENAGLIDRSRLLGITGRGRKDQLALAERFKLKEIPTPAGGCRLTEQENARSYWPVLKYAPEPRAADFALANTGRQFWHVGEEGGGVFWLCVGRNQDDNTALMRLAGARDLLFKVKDFPGPIALGRVFSGPWPAEAVRSAAALAASFSGKAVRENAASGAPTAVRVHEGSLDAPGTAAAVTPERRPAMGWGEYPWETAKAEIRAEAGAGGRA